VTATIVSDACCL